jgi:hypothetical protein
MNRRHDGSSLNSTSAIDSTTWNFLLTTETISDQYSLKTAIDFKSFNMEIGTLSNVSFVR